MDSYINLNRRTEFNLEDKEQNQSTFLEELTSNLQSSQMDTEGERQREHLRAHQSCGKVDMWQEERTKRQQHGWQPAAPLY